jgi:hypothetical protein
VVSKLLLCEKHPAGGPKRVYLTFAQALEVIRKLDHLTCGVPKLVYLVGWQFDGHDSKYPAWNEVNRYLKRPVEITAEQGGVARVRSPFTGEVVRLALRRGQTLRLPNDPPSFAEAIS